MKQWSLQALDARQGGGDETGGAVASSGREELARKAISYFSRAGGGKVMAGVVHTAQSAHAV